MRRPSRCSRRRRWQGKLYLFVAIDRTIKDATVRRFHYDSDDQLGQHLDDFVAAYNFGRRLKRLRGLTPYEFICFICKTWAAEPQRFTANPHHQMPGSNT